MIGHRSHVQSTIQAAPDLNYINSVQYDPKEHAKNKQSGLESAHLFARQPSGVHPKHVTIVLFLRKPKWHMQVKLPSADGS